MEKFEALKNQLDFAITRQGQSDIDNLPKEVVKDYQNRMVYQAGRAAAKESLIPNFFSRNSKEM